MRHTKYWEFFLVVAGGSVTVGLLMNLFHGTARDATLYGTVLLGGLILLWHILTGRERRRAHWVRTGLWMGGAMAIGWSLIGYTRLFASARLSHQTHHSLDYMEGVVGGMVLGILLLLVISGEFINFSSRKNTKNEVERTEDEQK